MLTDSERTDKSNKTKVVVRLIGAGGDYAFVVWMYPTSCLVA